MSESTILELTSELVRSQDQQLALYELSQAMRQQPGIQDAIDELALLVARTLKAQEVGVVITVPDRAPVVNRGLGNLITEASLMEWLQQVRTSDYYILRNDSSKYDNLLVLPIRLNGEISGVLAIINKVNGYMASPDRKLGQAIANQAGVHLENTLFTEARVSEAQIQTELRMARDVQMQLLPQQPPDVPGLDVFGFSEPALHVGGDSYDYLVRDNQFHFCVGDVAGKGMSAALLMAMMRTTLRNSWQFGGPVSPAETMRFTNGSLYDDFTETGLFATLFTASYDPETRILRYANAGHSPVIFRPHEGKARLLKADSVPVGVLTESLAENHELLLGEGDLLLVCTDGLNEARNQEGKLFGRDSLMKLIDELAELPSKVIAQELLAAVEKFADGQPQADDQTLVVIRGQAS